MYANADEQILFVSDQNENSGIYRDFQGVYSNMTAREDGFRQVAQALSSHRLYYGGECLSRAPDGQSILYSRGTENLYVTGIHGEGVNLFLRNAHSPDWKTPVSHEKVTAENKLHTTWGEVKK